MAHTGNGLVIIIVLYGLYGSVDGVKCYNCKSTDFPDRCGQSFRLNSTDTSFIVDNCDNCLKTVYKDTKVIIRNCTQSDRRSVSYRSGCQHVKDSGSDVSTCACTKDLCNTSAQQYSLTWALLLCFIQIVFIIISRQ